MTPAERINRLAAAGYETHLGTSAHAELAGRWWWTLYRPGWSGVETSSGTWATEDEALTDAWVHMASELMEP